MLASSELAASAACEQPVHLIRVAENAQENTLTEGADCRLDRFNTLDQGYCIMHCQDAKTSFVTYSRVLTGGIVAG